MKKSLWSFIPIVILFISSHVYAQERTVSGIVTASSDDVPLTGVNIVVKGIATGTITDNEGKFSLQVPLSATTLTFSFIGYVPQEVPIPDSNYLTVALESDISELNEIIVTGSRGSERTITDTPLPIDILPAKELTATGQYTFDKALQYRVPSFNTVQTPVNDATSLLDPYEIRNMGPSRTLILINGKRKNSSSLLYTQTSPGRGESGIDISAIPTDAVKRIEILRDGASAQYGSDAIAGVMNIILKDHPDEGSLTLRTGVTSEGDGGLFGISFNNGSKLFNEHGFINYTLDFSRVGLANRPGTVDAEGEASDFGADISDVNAFLAAKPDAGNINGSPETTAAKFLVNGGSDLSDNTSLYFNAAYVFKEVNSFANYRTPYWRTLEEFPYLIDFFPDGNGDYMGYVPTFDGRLDDYNATIGFKTRRNGWTTDLSLTLGGNKQTYTVRNSHNRSDTRNPSTYNGDLDGDGEVDLTPHDLDGNGEIDPANEGVELIQGTLKYRENSPITFRPGGSRFTHCWKPGFF